MNGHTKALTLLLITVALTACTKENAPGNPPQDAPAAHKTQPAAGDTVIPDLPVAAQLEIVPGMLNRDLYIEMKARHDIITARILNDPSIKPKMTPLKRDYNALCAEYKVTLSDFNEYDSDLITWGSENTDEFTALKDRINKRRLELLATMPK